MSKKTVKEYRVIQVFRDKNTLEYYGVGDTYEADAKRANELEGYIGEVRTDEKPSK